MIKLLQFIIKFLFFYICFFTVFLFIGVILGEIFDVERLAWDLYHYLRMNYGLYDGMYDFNPLLADLIMVWFLVIPFITSIIASVRIRLS